MTQDVNCVYKTHNVTVLRYLIARITKYRCAIFSDAVVALLTEARHDIKKRYEIKSLMIKPITLISNSYFNQFYCVKRSDI